MKKYEVVGLMSGTSLDGLDIAYVQFQKEAGWRFEVIACRSVPFETALREKLASTQNISALELKELDLQFGRWLGEQVKSFLKEIKKTPDLIVSHGHTIFHQPGKCLTMQIGDGYQIMLASGIKTICDLRSLDVALGGQGAPLVPVGDKLLFSEYEYCLNLGGFSNISYDQDGNRIAYDICPVNTVLNSLANKLGLAFDRNGELAAKGRTDVSLLAKLNALPFYSTNPPKSLGIEWVEKNIFPILKGNAIENLLNTFTHHIVEQIARSVTDSQVHNTNRKSKLLITGGGAKNTYLINCLRQKLEGQTEIVVPEETVIEFKEAIIFAFLGLLRLVGKNNTWKSVTGAKRDSSGGILFDPQTL